MKKMFLILLLVSVFSCEQTDYSNAECCWFCAISTTYYNDCNPYEVTQIERYEYCEMTDSAKVAWEIKYTGEGYTEDSVKYERIAWCRK
jgi:hypothetical protein